MHYIDNLTIYNLLYYQYIRKLKIIFKIKFDLLEYVVNDLLVNLSYFIIYLIWRNINE